MSEDKSTNHDERTEHEETEDESFGHWIQDNLRIIISIIIVILLAIGIYSYAQRSEQAQLAGTDHDGRVAFDEDEEAFFEDAEMADDHKHDHDLSDDVMTDDAADAEEDDDLSFFERLSNKLNEEDTDVADQDDAQQAVSADATSKETTTAFEETATPGDGPTHLARRATANYLAKYPNDVITPAHKVYIEDFLQERVVPSGELAPDQTVSFDKGLIKEAINEAKMLNDAQLRNLEKYAQNVSSF